MQRILVLICLACATCQIQNQKPFPWEPGKEYMYDVRTRVFTGPGKTSFYDGPEVDYSLRITVIGPNTVHFKPQNVKEIPGNRKLNPKLIEYLESPIQVEIQSGRLNSLKIEDSIPVWAHALKKAQVAQFIPSSRESRNDLSNHKTNSIRQDDTHNIFEAQENTTYGLCKVNYVLSQKLESIIEEHQTEEDSMSMGRSRNDVNTG